MAILANLANKINKYWRNHNLEINNVTNKKNGEEVFQILLFKNRNDNNPKSVTWTWNQVKEESGCFVIRENEDGWAFCPTKSNAGKIEVSMIVFEIKASQTLSEIIKELNKLGCALTIYSTFIENNYRVIIPLRKPITLEMFKELIVWLKNQIKMSVITKDAEELHFLPMMEKKREGLFEYQIIESNFLDWNIIVPHLDAGPKTETKILPLPNSYNSYEVNVSTQATTGGLLNQYSSKEKNEDCLSSNSSNSLDSDYKKSANCFHGLPGKIVKFIEPYTEADSLALLLNILIAFGNVIGRTAYFMADGSRHYTNLFGVLTGGTSAGKGTSWNQIKRIFAQVDYDWARNRIQSGLSSGEGLIYAVRANDENVDQRLLVVESEFVSVLSMTKREGNTLSAIIRGFWDDGSAQTMTKNDPVSVNDAHISIIGHITPDELGSRVSKTEISNGFVNRFLWIQVQRSKQLPDGGKVPDEVINKLITALAESVLFAQLVGEMERDEEAKELWRKSYGKLTRERSGAYGKATARARAQIVRLSMIYALMDKSHVIKLEHLQAAIDFWNHCENSAREIFGDSTGDKLADDIYKHLKSSNKGLTRTEITNLTNRNYSSNQIDAALVYNEPQKLDRSER